MVLKQITKLNHNSDFTWWDLGGFEPEPSRNSPIIFSSGALTNCATEIPNVIIMLNYHKCCISTVAWCSAHALHMWEAPGSIPGMVTESADGNLNIYMICPSSQFRNKRVHLGRGVPFGGLISCQGAD